MSPLEPLALSPVGTELLDDPAADPAAVAESLRNIARSNRWFGGAAAVRHGLARALAGVPAGSTLTLADLGTGLGGRAPGGGGWGARRGPRPGAGAAARGGGAGGRPAAVLWGGRRARGGAGARAHSGRSRWTSCW